MVLNKVLNEIDEGKYLEPSKEPFSAFIENWFNTSYKRSVEETTAETQWFIVKNHLIPYFGNIRIDIITTMLDDFYNDKLDERDILPDIEDGRWNYSGIFHK